MEISCYLSKVWNKNGSTSQLQANTSVTVLCLLALRQCSTIQHITDLLCPRWKVILFYFTSFHGR